jgi:3-mercaptopyruvate sulfurtransferase SseA
MPLPPLVSPEELSLTGRDDARLYDGSLTEWSAHPDLPLVTG